MAPKTHFLLNAFNLGPCSKTPSRTQGGNFETSVHPSVHLSFRSSLGHRNLKCAVSGLILALNLALSDLNLALESSNQLSSLHICPQDLKSALKTSNQLFWPQICSPGFKPAPKPQICSFGLNFAIPTSNPPQDVSKSTPLGPLPYSHSTTSLDHPKQGIWYR